jgi:hypothetical protein
MPSHPTGRNWSGGAAYPNEFPRVGVPLRRRGQENLFSWIACPDPSNGWNVVAIRAEDDRPMENTVDRIL